MLCKLEYFFYFCNSKFVGGNLFQNTTYLVLLVAPYSFTVLPAGSQTTKETFRTFFFEFFPPGL